jgi:hypothetical protein
VVQVKHLVGLHAKGLLPDLEGCHILLDHSIPRPGPNEVVSFTAFHERGLALPTLQFLYSLLSYYQIELRHLSLGGILHVTAFVMLCEAAGDPTTLRTTAYFFLARIGAKQLPVANNVIL